MLLGFGLGQGSNFSTCKGAPLVAPTVLPVVTKGLAVARGVNVWVWLGAIDAAIVTVVDGWVVEL